MLVNSITLL
jgi:hypothetical protein